MPEQHFTQPPPRFSEASLVKELEEKGIGRPSTYANIMSTIQDRGYVEKTEGRFYPTTLGTKVNDLLVESFPDILDVDLHRAMEDGLDHVEEGAARLGASCSATSTRRSSSTSSKAACTCATSSARRRRPSYKCEKCGSPMVIKWGRNGEFLACRGYPECKNTQGVHAQRTTARSRSRREPTTDEKCETCAAPMLVKRGRFGEFLACSRYPDCKTTRPISLGVDLPAAELRRLPHREALAARQGLLRLLATTRRPAATSCRGIGRCRAVPAVRRAVPGQAREPRGGARMRCVAEGCGYSESAGRGQRRRRPATRRRSSSDAAIAVAPLIADLDCALMAS